MSSASQPAPRPPRRSRARCEGRRRCRSSPGRSRSASRHSRQNARAWPRTTSARSQERPDVYAAWGELLGAIKANMDLRRYELATLAAARRLRSSYCSLAHGSGAARAATASRCSQIATDRDSAGLDAVDLAVMDLAERVVDDATKITDADLQRLRDLGLSDPEIMDVILAAACALLLDEDARLARRPARRDLRGDGARAPRGARRRPPDRDDRSGGRPWTTACCRQGGCRTDDGADGDADDDGAQDCRVNAWR